MDISQKFMSGQQYCALSMLIREIGKRVSAGGDEFVIPEPEREAVTYAEFYDEATENDEKSDLEDEKVEISKGGNKNVGYVFGLRCFRADDRRVCFRSERL